MEGRTASVIDLVRTSIKGGKRKKEKGKEI